MTNIARLGALWVTRDDSAEFLSSPAEPAQLGASYSLSRPQVWWQGQTSSTSPSSNVSASASSQLVLSPATTSTPALWSVQRRTQLTTALSTLLIDTSSLPAPPKLAATISATETSPALASFQRSKPTTDLSLTSQLIAELQATAANLDWQYNEWVWGMHSVNQDHVFPHTISHVNETDSAKKELKAIRERIAAVERECGRF
ncbi:hypothetical protein FRC01_009198 [Tulasnella sp. 417]|nr:hypothetical protein FRC01_009198 [Tulasnella sp. 417]